MSQIIPIYIPTLISDINYNPAKVYPRLFFYNGKVQCQPYYFEHKLASGSQYINTTQLDAFPYVDHYNVVTGSFPSPGSKSLLFLNETAVYGAEPTASLYTDYWETYINLLYDPKTRLINCSGIIPLADYFQMELNDIVNWRGNSYHLRAINNYSLTTGKCELQLLGPIIPDALTGTNPDCGFQFNVSNTLTTTTTSTTSTTSTSTTTTAPIPPVNCEYWGVESFGASSVWAFTDCASGNVNNLTIPADGDRSGCVRVPPTRVSGTANSYRYKSGNCTAPGTTTTTTSGPTTTTTGAPTTTTTLPPTTTTTTTTHSPNYYYLVQRYPCPTCSPVGGTQIGISSVALTNGLFYGYPGSGDSYQVQSEVATTSWSVDLNYMTGFSSCNSYCSS